jgi:hypothetical protein
MLTAVALLIGWRCVWAVTEPRPERVQPAVGNAVLAIAMLDAVICCAVCNGNEPLLILFLWLATMLLQRWLAMT